MKFIKYFIILCFFSCGSPAVFAGEPPVADGNIHITADNMTQDTATGVYTAEGHVIARLQGQTLVADKVRYEYTTHLLYAYGSVVLSKDTAVLTGDSLVMNIDTGHAEIDPALLKAPGSGITIIAEKLIRINENEYRGLSAEITSCDIPDPSWKFGTSTLNVELDSHASGRNVIFYVKDVPVLYLPWMAFPILNGKTSGLLLPKFGQSAKAGIKLDVPLYLVISPSQDLQLNFDIMSRRGVGIGADYRYIRKRGSEGFISAYQIYDTLEKRWRWQLAQQHKEIFSPTASLRMSVDATSDSTFLSDFGEKSGVYNRQSSDSTINTLNTWQNYAVTSFLRYTDNLYSANNRATLQALPTLGAAAVRQGMSSQPLYFDMDASAENLYRKTAPSGQRLHVFPRITVFPYKNSVLQSNLFAGVHVRGYATERRDNSAVQASAGDLLPEAGARISTSLTRVYDSGFSSLKKIRHEIIPDIRYSLVPEKDQQRLPYYDYTDRMIKQNMGTASITSLITGKFDSGDKTEYRDISRITVAADYLFSGQRRDLLTLVESQRPWSDLIVETETRLTDLVRVTFDTRYNPSENHLTTTSTGLEVSDRKGNSLGAGYQKVRNELEYFEGRFTVKPISPLKFSYSTRYTIDHKAFLSSDYSAEYRHKCWSLNLAFHQRPGNNSYTVSFNLAGL